MQTGAASMFLGHRTAAALPAACERYVPTGCYHLPGQPSCHLVNFTRQLLADRKMFGDNGGCDYSTCGSAGVSQQQLLHRGNPSSVILCSRSSIDCD